MSLLEWRGGFPVVFRGSVDNTGEVTDSRGGVIPAGTPIVLGAHQRQLQEDGRKGPITCKWMRIQNQELTAVRILQVYFSQDHFDDDVHFVAIPALGYWEGPVESREVWIKGAADNPIFDITAFVRRG